MTSPIGSTIRRYRKRRFSTLKNAINGTVVHYERGQRNLARSVLSKIESGERLPSKEVLDAICSSWGLSEEEVRELRREIWVERAKAFGAEEQWDLADLGVDVDAQVLVVAGQITRAMRQKLEDRGVFSPEWLDMRMDELRTICISEITAGFR